MHLEGCMRCGEDVDDLYRAKNPAWADWDLCLHCVTEVDAEMTAAPKEADMKDHAS